jgi:FkbM family methyltransferase
VGNSLGRRVVKRLLHPLLTDDLYAYVQALSVAWDIRTRGWSEPEVDLVPLAAHAGDTVLDLGGNFGYYSYHLSRAVGRTGHVYAFEPVPFTYRTFGIVTKLLGLHNVEIVPMGCSDRGGPITFEVPVQANGALSAGLAYIGGRKHDHPGRETQVRWRQTREVTATVLRLDDFLPPIPDLPLIKADVEGAELFAFRGGERTIVEHKPTVICEINPWYLKGFDVTVAELASFFLDKGYHLYHYDNKKLTPTTIASIIEDNYVFVHPTRIDRLRALIDD